ncbi:exosome complex component RRP45B isoform X3 [Gossypium hirsutum]|uniref:Exosome complex component RRP45B isoform X3 n=1 Tax=Gossypium hirsutum TaxID=3635 RepID=A0A1U8HT73_GOSHI|nr:exosome complex component RRP45B isoform X3 [Gossypium hirsutum]
MEGRLANSWRLTVNDKNFIKTALLSEIRIDGRKPFEYRKISIKFGREDGSSEVQLGQTRVMGMVTAQLVQPYRDRPKEGILSIFTEFSPMADPSFEPGRPGELAVELGRIIDRGLRNLVDAANIAALAALLTFRRPECSLGGEDGQEVIVHPPEIREPLPLTVHHLPIAISFGFFSNESILVIDPTHNEEAVMGGRMTTTVNANGDICAIQKSGGEGVPQRVIMQCLQLATSKAASITKQIKDAVEVVNTERALRKVKRHPTSTGVDVREKQN